MTPPAAIPASSVLPDLRHIPLRDLAAADVAAAIGRVLPAPEAASVPVAAFNSSI